MTIRWSNVPIPVQHLVGIAGAAVLQRVFPLRILVQRWMGHAVGWPLVATSVVLASWAVATAGATNVEAPDQLITGGPYARSRNPMYIAWAGLAVGIAFVLNTWWLLFLVPVLVGYTHYADVLQEEALLEKQFGDVYRRYRGRVRRYL